MHQMLKYVLLLKIVCILQVKMISSKYVEGHLMTPEKWIYLARFCFLSNDGQFEYHVEYNQKYAVQNMLLYYDSYDQWPSVYKTSKTCLEKEAILDADQNQIINLTQFEPSSGCSISTRRIMDDPNRVGNSTKKFIISCHSVRRFHSSRPRWWFLAVSNCNATNGLNIKYKILMTNGMPGNIWREHFSADEFYILPLLSVFFVAYMVIILATIACSMELKSRQLLHCTYKLFNVSVILQEAGIMLLSISYIKYGLDGVGEQSLKNLGRILESASENIFLLLLLLLAKGYTVTRAKLRLVSSIKLTIFMCSYVMATLALFFYENSLFDPGEVLYLYESPAGYGLLMLRTGAWVIFVYSTFFTLKHYPEKSNFYYPFNLIGTMWFITGPVFILIANSLIDKWIRESVVCAVQHFIALSGHLLFLLLTLPNKANKNFPYHVRTSQIGAMLTTTGAAENNNIYHFAHHTYAPTPYSYSFHNNVPVGLFSIDHDLSTRVSNNVVVVNNDLMKSSDYVDSKDSVLEMSTENDINATDSNILNAKLSPIIKTDYFLAPCVCAQISE